MASPTLNDDYIRNTLNTYKAGRQNDAVQAGKDVGNPWLVNIANDYQNIFGRLPTTQEVAQAMPAYQQPGGNGGAFVSNLYQQEQNSPDKIAAKQQADNLAKAPQFSGQVNNLFQGQFGRSATQDELNHFGSLLASGNSDPYQLQQFLQQQPEYTQKQDKNFQDQLSGQLSGYDQQYFKNNILPSLQEAYAKQGRSFDSSAFQGAATNSAQQQNVGRQQYLAGLSASQYQGRQQNAYQDYANAVANQQNLTNFGIQAKYGALQNTANRVNDLSDFNSQAQLYNSYLANYGKRNNGIGGLAGGLLGAGLGAYLGKGNPQAISAGYGVGSGLGTAGQNAYGGSY